MLYSNDSDKRKPKLTVPVISMPPHATQTQLNRTKNLHGIVMTYYQDKI